MSKIIETLKASSFENHKREVSPKDALPPKSEADQTRKSNYQMIQEQLAKTYFSSPEKFEKLDHPLIIKVVDKPKIYYIFPWVMSILAFAIAIFALFSAKRIFIDIKVIDDQKAVIASYRETLPVKEDEGGETKAETKPSQPQEETPVLRYGDRIPMEGAAFDGAAKLKSSSDKNSLTLINSSVAPFARATLNFAHPVNMVASKLIFYVKGSKGGENLAIALKDTENVLAFSKGKIYPFPDGLIPDWQRVEIPLMATTKNFNPKNVSSIRFEFGSKDTENKPGDIVFVRDLRVEPL